MKKIIWQMCLLFVVCLIAVFGYVKEAIEQTSTKPITTPTIIIDPGHGGFDGGAVANDGTVEKDINLTISKSLAHILRFNGFQVIMTRTTDSGTDEISGSLAKRKKNDLQNRLSLMEKNPDAIYISVHLNKFTTSAACGTQVFYTPNFKEARELSLSVQRTVISMLQPENTRVVKQGNSSTYLLKNAKVPAIIVECGFLSNKYDLEKLKNKEYQSQMAFAIASGIMEFYSEE